jgi:serine/threonine protein kinase
MRDFIDRTFVNVADKILVCNDDWLCLFYKKYDGGDLIKVYNNTIISISTTYDVENILENIQKLGVFLKSFLINLHTNGMCHRDIKLENILCSKEKLSDPTCSFTVGDFGLACVLASSVKDGGTPDYMSPYLSRSNVNYFTREFPQLRTFKANQVNIRNRWTDWMSNEENIIKKDNIAHNKDDDNALVNKKAYIAKARRYSDFYAMHMVLVRLYDMLHGYLRESNDYEHFSSHVELLKKQNIDDLHSFRYDTDAYRSQSGGSPTKSIIKYTPTNRTYIVRLDKVSNQKYICMKVENSTTGKRTEKVYLSAIKGKYKYKHVK